MQCRGESYGIRHFEILFSDKMKVSSFDCSIFTPEKKIPSSGDIITPEKNNLSENERPLRTPAPTNEQTQLLLALERSHKFFCHGQVKYSELEERGLSPTIVEEIQRFFQDNMPDLHDSLLKQEEEAIKIEEFCDMTRKFISEEFEVPAEYSFLIICLLCYSHDHAMSVSESGNDLLKLHSEDYICDACSPSTAEPQISENNLLALKSLLNKTLLDVSHDDSFCDKLYHPQSEESPSESELTDVYDLKDIQKCDDDDDSSFESLEIFNPFAKSSETASQLINSTMQSRYKSDQESYFPTESSPIQHRNKGQTSCKLCGKSFNKLYNLKMHLVHVHKHFPKGMVIFECPVPGCSFVAGNKIIFDRHSHKKKVNNVKINLCNLCNERFSTKGSLVRHINRKHKSVS